MLSAVVMVSCAGQDEPATGGNAGNGVMVEVRPSLPGVYNVLGRSDEASSRTYVSDDQTNEDLNKTIPLPEGSTVWLIAQNGSKLIKNSYVVYNSEESAESGISYLVPCEVDDEGNVTSMEGTPLYLREGDKYMFYAVSPARKLDESLLNQGIVGFKIKNGEYFYANDCRYAKTTPKEFTIKAEGIEGVQRINLVPMVNQTAQIKFQIVPGENVHDLDMQPGGVRISGLQNDSPTPGIYGDADGIQWKMSLTPGQQPILLQHGDKAGVHNEYEYTIDSQRRVNVNVGIIPMYSIPKPVIVLLRLKVNGVPSTYEMMLNEKDFKAGYSYGYRGEVSISGGIDVVSWQYISWETEVEFPFQ